MYYFILSLFYLRLDVDLLRGVGVEPAHVYLAIKMSDVAHYGVILHALKVTEGVERGKKKKHISKTPKRSHGRQLCTQVGPD